MWCPQERGEPTQWPWRQVKKYKSRAQPVGKRSSIIGPDSCNVGHGSGPRTGYKQRGSMGKELLEREKWRSDCESVEVNNDKGSQLGRMLCHTTDGRFRNAVAKIRYSHIARQQKHELKMDSSWWCANHDDQMRRSFGLHGQRSANMVCEYCEIKKRRVVARTYKGRTKGNKEECTQTHTHCSSMVSQRSLDTKNDGKKWIG